MKFNLSLLIFFTTLQLFSQEKINTYDLYTKNNLSYTKKDNQLFSGLAELKKSNGQIILEKYYESGQLTKYIEFYNDESKEVKYKETTFLKDSGFKQIEIKYSLVENERREMTYYDQAGKKKLNEIYNNGKLIYSCEFLNNKKHGKEFCTTKKCDNQTDYYENGKKIVNALN